MGQRLLACAVVALAACAGTPAVDGPIVRAPATRPAPAAAPARLVVASYNVHLGAEPEAIAAALVRGGLGEVDVLLVQEIEDHWPGEPRPRAEALAAALGMAVVYAPARQLEHGGLGNHGLAVLSRWPITDDVVLRLPHHELLWRTRPRIALGVVIDVAGTPVQIWNVHLDTRIAVEDRVAQLEPVFERAQTLPGLAIVGGDLSAWSRVHEQAVDRLAATWRFTTPTAALTGTMPASRWPPHPGMRPDAIYTRGFAIEDAGVDREVTGSDHVPIWVALAWPAAAAR